MSKMYQFRYKFLDSDQSEERNRYFFFSVDTFCLVEKCADFFRTYLVSDLKCCTDGALRVQFFDKIKRKILRAKKLLRNS